MGRSEGCTRSGRRSESLSFRRTPFHLGKAVLNVAGNRYPWPDRVCGNLSMKTIPVKTTYLQMFAAPRHDATPPPEGTKIIRVEKPTIRYYRFLYDSVGNDWNWLERRALSDEQLSRVIHDDRVEVHVLYVNGSAAGFGELDRRQDDQIQLMYFGIMREFFGKGLGRFFLRWIVNKAWSYNPTRLWVHTCQQDHQAALPLYQKTGFEIYDQKMLDTPMPE